MQCPTSDRRGRALVLAIAAVFSSALAVRGQDSAVILGGGRAGSWSTKGFVANTSGDVIGINVLPLDAPCPAVCILPSISLPARASASLDLVLALSGAAGQFETFYVRGFHGSTDRVPAVSARFVDDSRPDRSVEIPVVLQSRLEAANLSTLSFGGVTLAGPAHSSLVLGNVARISFNTDENLPVTLELFDSAGTLVASGALTIPFEGTALMGDIVSYLGAGSLSLGQLRVTRMGGNALMWGILYTVDQNGAVTSTPGARLSP